jgi:hypothetical protein
MSAHAIAMSHDHPSTTIIKQPGDRIMRFDEPGANPAHKNQHNHERHNLVDVLPQELHAMALP